MRSKIVNLLSFLTEKKKCNGCLVHFGYNANYASVLTVELEMKLSSVSNKHVSHAVFQTLQRTKTNFEKLLSLQVFKNHNCSPFQSSSSLSIRDSFCICCVIKYLLLLFWAVIFMFYQKLITAWHVQLAWIFIFLINIWKPSLRPQERQ